VDPMHIEELEENKGEEQRFIEAQTTQKDVEEEEIFVVGVQPSIEMHTSTEVQPSVMEINMNVPSVIEVIKQTTFMDKPTLLDKGICIPDLDRFMWI